MRLNIGDGGIDVDGYVGVDRKRGQEAFPLDYEDGSVEEIRASHVLEHFSHRDVADVLREWVRVLKPGGVLKVAVPNFGYVAEQYLAGNPINVQGYVMGGHVDDDDRHGCVFDDSSLREVMEEAGLVNIVEWQDDIEDCARLPVSLNLKGWKRAEKTPQQKRQFVDAVKMRAKETQAVMSMPRLTFTDNFFSAMRALAPLGIGIRKTTGAFWGQCLERGVDAAIADGARWVLTVDYDTVYTVDDVKALLALSVKYPDADAIAPIQASRTKATPLMTVRGEDGQNTGVLERAFFAPDLSQVATAHFGLTLIRVEAIQKLPRPLFQGVPDEAGGWGDNRTDEDIWFWRQFEDAGFNLMLANRVAVGHAELMIRWPDENLSAIYQHPQAFWDGGKPGDVWT